MPDALTIGQNRPSSLGMSSLPRNKRESPPLSYHIIFQGKKEMPIQSSFAPLPLSRQVSPPSAEVTDVALSPIEQRERENREAAAAIPSSWPARPQSRWNGLIDFGLEDDRPYRKASRPQGRGTDRDKRCTSESIHVARHTMFS